MSRKVIQITANPDLYVLCDDGEMFRLSGSAWYPVPPIPQGEPQNLSRQPGDPQKR
jgi:hypothetical protein